MAQSALTVVVEKIFGTMIGFRPIMKRQWCNRGFEIQPRHPLCLSYPVLPRLLCGGLLSSVCSDFVIGGQRAVMTWGTSNSTFEFLKSKHIQLSIRKVTTHNGEDSCRLPARRCPLLHQSSGRWSGFSLDRARTASDRRCIIPRVRRASWHAW